MTASSYDAEKDGNENRILFWLRLDDWNLCEAALLFVDIDPQSVEWHKNLWCELKTLKGITHSVYGFENNTEDVAEIRKDIEKYKRKYSDVRRILFNQEIEFEFLPIDSPQNWINLAVAKKIAIPWLNFVIERGFYKPETVKASTDIYSTDLLNILIQAANEFFNPRKNLDAKKEEVTQWIINKGKENKINISSNIADAMFTIIKPNDHNPKKRLNP